MHVKRLGFGGGEKMLHVQLNVLKINCVLSLSVPLFMHKISSESVSEMFAMVERWMEINDC